MEYHAVGLSAVLHTATAVQNTDVVRYMAVS